MSPLAFYRGLLARGVVLTPRQGKLVVDAPAGALSQDDREMLARHKAELLGLLAGGLTPGDLPPDWYVAWDERSAVLEYEAGILRERAEALALAEIVRQMAGTG
jgi:hypothetical protein